LGKRILGKATHSEIVLKHLYSQFISWGSRGRGSYRQCSPIHKTKLNFWAIYLEFSVNLQVQCQKNLLAKCYQGKIPSRILIFHLGVVFELNNHEQKSNNRVQDAENGRSVNGEKSRCMKLRLVV
jgi:hypothetical protein